MNNIVKELFNMQSKAKTKAQKQFWIYEVGDNSDGRYTTLENKESLITIYKVMCSSSIENGYIFDTEHDLKNFYKYIENQKFFILSCLMPNNELFMCNEAATYKGFREINKKDLSRIKKHYKHYEHPEFPENTPDNGLPKVPSSDIRITDAELTIDPESLDEITFFITNNSELNIKSIYTCAGYPFCFYNISDVLKYFNLPKSVFFKYLSVPKKSCILKINRTEIEKRFADRLITSKYDNEYISGEILYFIIFRLNMAGCVNTGKTSRLLTTIDSQNPTKFTCTPFIIKLLNTKPNINMSNGEKRIYKYLEEQQISYYYGYVMKDGLHLDFYLPKRRIGIEYDGQQHYEPVKKFGGKRTWIKQCKNDREKELYCHQHHIKLIRIPYWDYDKINSVLKTKL